MVEGAGGGSETYVRMFEIVRRSLHRFDVLRFFVFFTQSAPSGGHFFGRNGMIKSGSKETSGKSYKHFTLVNYDSRVVIWSNFQSGTTLEL